MRVILGVIVGVVVANLFVFGWEVGVLPYLPFGRSYAAADLQQAGVVAALPFAAKLWVVAGWLLGTLAGAFAAFAIARSDWAGWVVAAVVGAASIANVVMIPHPLWMQLAAVAAPFVGALFGFGLYRRWRATRLHIRS